MIRAAFALALAAVSTLFGVAEQDDDRAPVAWRPLRADEAARFDLGYAVFNTSWVPANAPAGRRDGLGPQFNAASCDACHNSRRRGRGPLDAGPAPTDLVMQLGTRQADGSVERGTRRFGFILNTAANGGLRPEAGISIRYRESVRRREDGSQVVLHVPSYEITPGDDNRPLSPDTVLMPRMPPQVQGVGLLERVPEAEIVRRAGAGGVRGRVSWLRGDDGARRIGRFGWQATEAGVADQIGVAFAREMGLTNPAMAHDDCAQDAPACRDAPSGGDPEVAPELFEAVVAFQRLEAVRRTPAAAARAQSAAGARLFRDTGCAACHVPALRTEGADAGATAQEIPAYTDLLLHDLGPELADRDAAGRIVPSAWRTAPLWGLNLSFAGGRPVRLLHDGRARGIDEAIAWHGGEAEASRLRYERLRADRRQLLIDWIASL